ncbi:MAG: TetR/AcrR family transcriptional regulator [Flavobacteriales bacterium]|nr:hypothetical protein [Flavobacteriales bacterium]MCC6577404.1 TetR/AcrR family transcriptional regulator [Flavobacteriales bacterium]NUQ13823.1 TetR/AcrR family transcriptional regulator [Flavobacteriales bacterium]
MTKEPRTDTRDRILEAACKLFREKGMDGVNVRELADAAAVNKGLLHYYFKSKEAILQEVVVHEIEGFYHALNVLLQEPGSLHDKVPALVNSYFQLLERSPGLPAFILFEMQRDPAVLSRTTVPASLQQVVDAVEPELKRARVPQERASGVHFVLDVVGLCAFTFGTVQGLSKLMKFTKAQRAAFLEARKVHIIALIRQGLKP